jgi:hypothetical protein
MSNWKYIAAGCIAIILGWGLFLLMFWIAAHIAKAVWQ